jgi:hypothetical protein
MKLTDEQYFDLLKRALQRIKESNDKVRGCDSTSIGNKYTECNVGLCDDSLTTKEIAMFPEFWDKGRRDMKYLRVYHKCPLDWRDKPTQQGCFYSCLFFKKGLRDKNKIIKLYEQRISEVGNQKFKMEIY